MEILTFKNYFIIEFTRWPKLDHHWYLKSLDGCFILVWVSSAMREITEQLELDINAVGRRLNGPEDRRLRIEPKVSGSSPKNWIADAHCWGAPY